LNYMAAQFKKPGQEFPGPDYPVYTEQPEELPFPGPHYPAEIDQSHYKLFLEWRKSVNKFCSKQHQTDHQFWYLAENYHPWHRSESYNVNGRLISTLCPRRHQPAVRRDDAIEILAPFLCSVWDVMVKEFDTIPVDGEPISFLIPSTGSRLALMSNVPQLIRKFSYSPDTNIWSVSPNDVLDIPERANIAYVTIPILPHDAVVYRATNMVLLWQLAVREIRAEANWLHSENGGNVNTDPPKIIIKILWNELGYFGYKGTGQDQDQGQGQDQDQGQDQGRNRRNPPFPSASYEFILKVAAIRLSNCVDAIELVTFESLDHAAGILDQLNKRSFETSTNDVDLEAISRQRQRQRQRQSSVKPTV